MKSWTIVGYIYNADIYCPACTVELVENRLSDDHPYWDEAGMGFASAETVLARLAPALGITNREDESSFDSGDFPKVVFADSECGEHCGNCHDALVEHDCPDECYQN